MKTISYFLFLCSFFSLHISSAQNCSSLAVWNDILEEEFPDLNPHQLRSGTRESNRLLYNLYTDKYFIPFAGKSYDQLTAKEAYSKWNKLAGTCRKKKEYANLKFMGWIDAFGLEPLMNEAKTTLVKQQSSILNKNRLEYEASLKEMKINHEDHNKSIAEVKRQFAWLMPSEIDEYVSIFTKKIVKEANEGLLKGAENIAKSANDTSVLHELTQFRDNQSTFFSQADTLVQVQVDKILDDKVEKILEVVIPQEIKSISELDNSEASLVKIELFRKNFEKYYTSYIDRKEVKSLKMAIPDKKTQIILALSKEIRRQISQAPNSLTLIGLSEKYLDHVDYSDPQVDSFRDAIRDREEQLKKEAYEISKTLELKNKAFIDFANKRSEQIKTKRGVLQIQHGIKLLDFTQLESILVDYFNLDNGHGTYKVKEAAVFFKTIENLGFKRIKDGDKKLSDIEEFISDKGNKIRIFMADVMNKNSLTTVEFIINKPPKEIIDLYWLELNRGFRKSSKTSSEFREEFEKYYKREVYSPPAFSGTSGLYTHLGNVLYDMEVKEDGSLELSVYGNFDASSTIMTERESDTELSVSSWTNRTDIYLEEGDKISIIASGNIKIAPLWSTTPAGLNGLDSYSYKTHLRHGSLIGKIGNGEWFFIGERKLIKAENSGYLYLRLNESHVENNSGGQWTVKYAIDKSSER